MQSLYFIQNATLEIPVFILLIYFFGVRFCILSRRGRLGLVITYIFGLHCCYGGNKEVMMQAFGDFFHLFNFLFFGFGILLLTLVIYTLIVGD